MDLYSLTLLASMAALGAGLGTALGSRLARDRIETPANLRAVARRFLIAALVLVAISAVYHLLSWHRPGSPQALGPVAFFGEHVAFAVLPALAAVGLGWIAQAVRSPR